MHTRNKDNNIILMIRLMLFIDQHLGQCSSSKKIGRPSKVTDLDVLTILLYDFLTEGHHHFKGIYNYIKREYDDCFRLPSYQNFHAKVKKLLPLMESLLKDLLISQSSLIFVDSTPLPVCKPIRVKNFKVIKDKSLVGFTKNKAGWHFGFKLHLSINRSGLITALGLTKASCHDVNHLEALLCESSKTIVGDSHYGGRPIVAKLKQRGIRIISNAQNKDTRSSLENKLLALRSKIESLFGLLKTKYGLMTSYARSYTGYKLHYIKTLLSYQLSQLFKLAS